MQYRSTRGDIPVSLDEAIVLGIADNGGLFLPSELPAFDDKAFIGVDSMHDVASAFLRPFFEGSSLEDELDDIVSETFRFPIPMSSMPFEDGYCGILELFHGPTAAFKDVGAGFLAACLSRLEGDPDNPLTILVATSGDTGGAVAAAFDGRAGMRVAVLYPDGRVSDRQAHQLTCWSENVLSLAVKGTFDDCQGLVKGAMGDASLSALHRFSSANSINIGRLLPQCIYYAHSALMHYHATSRKPSYIVPTGNLGNAFACYLAREMGLPIGNIILATNANRTIVDYLDSSEWSPRTSVQTLASAMDVGNPSNMERLRSHGGDANSLARQVRATSVSDDEIRAEILRVFAEFDRVVCPHTATATFAWHSLTTEEKRTQDWILAGTAHASKFEQIVEPIIGQLVPVPDELAGILSRRRRFVTIEPTMKALTEALCAGFG